MLKRCPKFEMVLLLVMVSTFLKIHKCNDVHVPHTEFTQLPTHYQLFLKLYFSESKSESSPAAVLKVIRHHAVCHKE